MSLCGEYVKTCNTSSCWDDMKHANDGFDFSWDCLGFINSDMKDLFVSWGRGLVMCKNSDPHEVG